MARYYNRAQTGGGCMFDMGHHAVHVLLWFLGRPTSVTGVFSCFSETARKNNVDDIAAALYSFPSGAIGITETGYLCPGGNSVFELWGTKGQLRWSREPEGLKYRFDALEPWIVVPEDTLPAGAPYPLQYWMECVFEGKPATQYTIAEAATVVQMIAAAYQAEGGTVPVAYF